MPTNLENRLRGYWSFNADATNSLGETALNGTSTSATFVEAGVRGNSATFTGVSTSQGIVIPGLDTFKEIYTTGIFTLSFWIKPVDNSAVMFVMGNASGVAGTKGFYIGFNMNSAGTGGLSFIMYNGGLTNLTDNNTLLDNNWTHIVYVGDGQNVYLYKNGVARNTSPPYSPQGTTTAPNTLRIGGNAGLTTNLLNGQIDELGYWTRTLTDVEIKTLYNQGYGLTYPLDNADRAMVQNEYGLENSLIGFWPLNGNALDVYNRNNGTVTSSSFGPGKIGNALQVTSTSSRVTIPSSVSMNSPTTALSFSCWIKPEAAETRYWVFKESSGGSATFWFAAFGSIFSARTFGAGGVVNALSAYTAGTWYHLVMTWVSNATLKFYINGVLQGTDASPGPIVMTNTDLHIGNTISTPGTNGMVDSAGYWSRELSQAEVTKLYNGGSGLSWPFFTRLTLNNSSKILDTFSGSFAGYSLRKLRTFHSGSAALIRRDLDNAETNIGFTGAGLFDETTYNEFVGNSLRLDSANYLKLDSNVTDSMGPLSATANNITYTTGKQGNCAVFNGTTSFISYTATDFGATTKTVSLWFYPTGTNTVILGNSGNVNVYVYFSSLTTISVQGNTAGVATFTVPSITLNAWHHLIVTKDVGTTRVYVDNVESSSGALSTATMTLDQIGKYYTGAFGLFFAGRIDEFGVWNRVLTSTERSILYNSGNGMTMPYSGRGFVKTLYDQGTGGFDVTQTDNSLQPKIFIGEGEPVIDFTQNGSPYGHLINSHASIGTTFGGTGKQSTVFVRYRQTANVSFNTPFILASPNTTWFAYQHLWSGSANIGERYDDADSSTSAFTATQLLTGEWVTFTSVLSTYAKAFINGTSVTTTPTARKSKAASVTTIQVGGGSPSLALQGRLLDAIIYATDKETTQASIAAKIAEKSTLISTNGLIINLDSSTANSFPGGATWTDLAYAQNHHATMTNRPMLLNQNGGVIDFNGTDQYGEISYSFGQITGARSYSVWIKYDKVTGLHNGFALTGIQQLGAYNYIGVQNGGAYYFYVGTGDTGNGAVATCVLSPNIWYHQCVVLNADGSRTAYLDGTPIYTAAGSLGSAPSNVFGVGMVNDGFNGRQHWIDGQIGQVLQYNRALSDAEVLNNYNATRARFGKSLALPATITPVATPPPSSFPSSTLVAYYKFENNVLDSFGSRHGTNVTAVTYTTGEYGQGIVYNGASTNYTTFPPMGITGTQPWTGMCWVKVSGSGTYGICGFGAEASGQAFWWYMNNGRIWFDWYSSGALLSGNTTGLNNNTWQHVAVKYTGTHMSIYVNGVLDCTPLAQSVNIGNNYFWLAKVYSGAGSAMFNGAMDDFYFFNSALSDAEILSIANGAVYS